MYQLPFFKSFWENQANFEEEIELEPEFVESDSSQEEDDAQMKTTVKMPFGKEKNDNSLKHQKQ